MQLASPRSAAMRDERIEDVTHVLIGDTRSIANIRRLSEIGWGRMFASVKPTPFPGERWAFDNGAFKCWQDGLPFDEKKFCDRLAYCILQRDHLGLPYLAVTPDIVAAGSQSLSFSMKWIDKLRDTPGVHDWPWYLAVQDGMTIHDVKPILGKFAGIFLGGSNTFKSQAWRWRVFAKDNGKPFHYARAGTLPKLESALKMHADSLDSAYPLWEKERFEKFQTMYHYWLKNPRPKLNFGGDGEHLSTSVPS